MTTFATGEPCWLDVSTADPEASRRFYAALLGWQYRFDQHPESGGYAYAIVDGKPVAGVSGQPGANPASWTLYLAIGDIARTSSLVTNNGGQILYGPADFPARGTMLVGTDASGAVIGFWRPEPSWTLRTGGPGGLYWADLNTWDPGRADRFFANLFGYRIDGDGDYANYDLGRRGGLGRAWIGATDLPDSTPPHWMPYFAVDPRVGVDAATDRARELGGRVLIWPYDTEFSRIAVLADPAGAIVAIVDPITRDTGGARNDDPYDD